MSGHALTAPCQHCGGALSITLAGALAPCSYCGQPFAVGAELERTIAALRQRIADRDARKEQLIGRQARLGREHGLGLLIMPASVWVLGFFTIWFMIDTPGVAVWPMLSTVSEGDTAHKAWLISALTFGLGINLIGFGIAVIRARRVISHAFPMPPAAEGKPPRCRVCNGELDSEGRVRQCGFCGADHLVLGRYQKADAEIGRALAARGRELGRSLESRSKAVWSTLTLGVVLSIGVLLAAPVVFFIGPYQPLAFQAAIATVGLGVVLTGIGAALPVPTIRTLEEAMHGDRLMVDGEELIVLGQLHLPAPADTPTSYAMLIGEAQGAPRLALRMPIDESETLTYVTVEVGGAALEPGEVSTLVSLNRDRRIVAGPLANTAPSGLWRSHGGAVWLAPPSPGDAPSFTTSLPKRIERRRLAFRTTLET